MGARRALLPNGNFHPFRDTLSASGTATQSDEIKVIPYQEITNPTPLVTQMSLAEMDSLISPFIRRRSDEFTQQETSLLIEEIGKLRHILLSKASQHTGLKKKAWEEVASNLALRYPCGPKRCGMQLKKKWENIVLKTRKTLRDGLLKEELKRNKSLRMVVQFLIEVNQTKKRIEESQRTGSPFGAETVASTQEMMEAANNASNFDDRIQSPKVVHIKRDENETAPPSTSIASNAGARTTTNSTDVNSDEESDENSSDTEDSTVPIALLNANGRAGGWSTGDESNLTERRKRKILNKELLRQARAEHERRMTILEIKHRYWKLKFDSLKRKVAQEEQQE